MSSQKYLFKKNRALQDAANLGRGVFKPAAAQQAAVTPTPPESLPKPKHAYQDMIFLTEYDKTTKFTIQREGLNFTLTHTPTKNVFAMEQLVDPASQKTHGRQLSTDEALYVIGLIEANFDPLDLTRTQPALDALKKDLPFTPYPRKPACINAMRTGYECQVHGYQYEIDFNATKFTVRYRDAHNSNVVSTRTMRAEEMAMVRRAIANSFTTTAAIQNQAFLEKIEKAQYDLKPA